MAVFKCKMCGGSLDIADGATVAECAFCGTKQTVPRLTDEKRTNLYDRANHFRRVGDYDKAMSLYEQILAEDSTDAEAYWSIVLCRFGIEYVEDPTSHRRVPTVHRTQMTSVLADEDYLSALSYADGYQREILEAEAKEIDRLQKEILAISQKEKPFDVFICYKETGDDGERTKDSVLAQDIYFALTKEGLKVFFARITLEDKLGSAYEPYIFAALRSAKVMVVLGTKPEHFRSVWVKNEWSRFLSLMQREGHRALIPAYRDMDPYDLPDDFSHLQALDMSKIGFLQDLVCGIRKIVDADSSNRATVQTEPQTPISMGTTPLLKRAFIFLEDGDWDNANAYCERVLDIDPECAMAYLGKLMVELRLHKQEDLADQSESFDNNGNYRKALRFADDELKRVLTGYADRCHLLLEEARKNAILSEAQEHISEARIGNQAFEYREAIKLLEAIPGWRDADEQKALCVEAIKKLDARAAKEAREAKKRKRRIIISWCLVGAVIAISILIGSIYSIVDSEQRAGLVLKRVDGGYAVVNGHDASGEFVIPSSYKELPIVAIESSAFSHCEDLTQITIPDSVTSIGTLAFSGCSALTQITIPNSVESIEKWAFQDCTSLERITISENLMTIGDNAFENCSGLKLITVPKKVNDIGNYAFKDCTSLLSVIILNGVETIGYGAFENCSSLKQISFPNSINTVAERVFSGCSQLEKIVVGSGNTKYHASGNCLIETSTKTLVAGCKNSVIPADGSVTTIGDAAFFGCTGLAQIDIPKAVIRIGKSAFESTAYYNKAGHWENGVLYIGDCLIKAQTSLSGSYSVKGGTRVIADRAFNSCEELTYITFPVSLQSIGSYVFYGSKNLTKTHYEGTQEQWDAVMKGANWNVIGGGPITIFTGGS